MVVITFSRKRRIWSFHVVVLQRTAKECNKIYNARAQLLFCSLNLLFCRCRRVLRKVPNNVKGLRGLRNANYAQKVFAFPCGIERPYCIFGLSTFVNSQDPDNCEFCWWNINLFSIGRRTSLFILVDNNNCVKRFHEREGLFQRNILA